MPDDARALTGVTPRKNPRTASAPAGAHAPAAQDSDLLQRITAAKGIDPTVIRVLQGETTLSACSTAAWARRLSRANSKPTSATWRPACLTRCARGNRQQLAAVLADASALAGWRAIDMGRLPRAWAHFERATRAAREATDNCLLAFSAGEQAYVLLDLKQPTEALSYGAGRL
jgi:hypothetical protein